MSVSNKTSQDMTITKHWKLDYFKLPRKIKTSIEEFVEHEVTIEDDIEMEEVLKLMNKAEANVAAAKKKKATKKDEDDDDMTLMDKIKQAADGKSEDEPPTKKVKTELPSDFDQLVQAYQKLTSQKRTVEVLKDYLR